MFSKILFVLIFCTLYFAVRAPDYDIPLAGEDGIFADIFVNAPPRPNYGQNARVNGITIYASLGHPAPLYEWLAISGKFFNKVLPLQEALNDPASKLSTYLRFSFSCFQFLAWLILIVYLLTHSKENFRWKSLFLVLAIAISPPAVIYSLWIQVDNASGSIIAALMMSAILFWDRYKHASTKKLFMLLFASGFVSALGKNEWSILVFLALMASAAFVFIRNKYDNQNAEFKSSLEYKYLLSMLLGLVAGNILSYMINPDTYMAGFELMTDMSKKSSLMNTNQVGNWWSLTKIRMQILYLGMALWLYMTSVFVKKSPLKVSTPIVLSFFLSSALLWSFFITSWDPTERYFIPAFIALTYTIMLIRANQRLYLDKFVVYIILILSIDSMISFAMSRDNHEYRVENFSKYLNSLPSKQGCIHHIQYYAFNLKNIDYVAVGNGPGNLEGHLKKSGLKVCE